MGHWLTVSFSALDSRDREWQKWPVTVVTGAYVGWAMGNFLGAYVLRGRVVDISD